MKRQEKWETQTSAARTRAIKRITISAISVMVIAGGIGSVVWYVATRPSLPENEIIARNGIHWHPELSIFIKGEKQEIPADIGIGVIHQPLHTHDATGVLHLEFQGLVRKQDITLSQFFKNWGKDMQSFGTNMKMMVNGKENTEWENYVMRDKDKIELRFDEEEATTN